MSNVVIGKSIVLYTLFEQLGEEVLIEINICSFQFEMLTGTLPFQGKDRNETMNMILK